MVLAIGTAAYDLFFPLSGWLEENRKYEIPASQESGGGPAANAAFLLSLWGVPAALACVLGDDLYGRRILEEFRQAGTDLRLTEVRAGAATPLSVILVNTTNGSRTLVNRLPPAEPLRFGPEALARLAELRPQVLLFDGHQPEAALQAMALFPRARTILDAGLPPAGHRAAGPARGVPGAFGALRPVHDRGERPGFGGRGPALPGRLEQAERTGGGGHPW